MHENNVPGSMRTSCAPKRRNKNDFVFSLKYSQHNKLEQNDAIYQDHHCSFAELPFIFQGVITR